MWFWVWFLVKIEDSNKISRYMGGGSDMLVYIGIQRGDSLLNLPLRVLEEDTHRRLPQALDLLPIDLDPIN